MDLPELKFDFPELNFPDTDIDMEMQKLEFPELEIDVPDMKMDFPEYEFTDLMKELDNSAAALQGDPI